MRFKKIMVPVDGSEHSMHAAKVALEIVKLTDGEIIILHCHKSFPVILGEPYFQRAVDKLIEKSEKLVQPYKKIFEDARINITDRIMEGNPAEIIAETAKIEACDLIIMGSRGLNDLEGLLLGSVTHRVLKTAHCPVMVTR